MLATKSMWTAFCVFLSLALLVTVSEAQFKVTDNFKRADGSVGLGWSAYGNGAQISGNQLETFGQINVGGGIERTLDVTFPLVFSFYFSTDAPSNGGWNIGFNAANTNYLVTENTSEVMLWQNDGLDGVCTIFQTSSGASMQCGNPVKGQRDFTAQALITVTVNSDFSATIHIKYNDGLTPATVTIKTSAPPGAILSPVGNILFFGNSNDSYGPHFFGNFSLTLK